MIESCPHCHHEVRLEQGHGDITYFLCDGCGMVASFMPSKKGQAAIDAFNRRENRHTIMINLLLGEAEQQQMEFDQMAATVRDLEAKLTSVRAELQALRMEHPSDCCRGDEICAEQCRCDERDAELACLVPRDQAPANKFPDISTNHGDG